MDRSPSAVAILCTLLLAVAILGAGSALAATVDDDPLPRTVTTQNDTVGYLAVDGTSTQQTVTPDLSAALAGEQETAQATLEAGRFEAAFDTAANRSAKLDTIETTLGRLHTRADSLQDQRRDAVRSFARGESTSTTLVGELDRLRVAADGLDSAASTVRETVQASDMSLPDTIATELTALEGELVTLRGSVTKRLAAPIRGNVASRTVGVRASESGIALGVIDGDQFVREATAWDERADSGPNQFAGGDTSPLTGAYRAVQTTYPWAVENVESGLSVTGFGNSTIYEVELTHSHGDLTTYLDGRTTNVFHEIQHLELSGLPTETIAANTTDDLVVEVNTTAAGPRSVTVRNATTGEAVAAEITVAGDGSTRSTVASQLWLLEADHERTITVRRADGPTVSVTIDA